MSDAEVPIEVLARYFRVPTEGVAVDFPGREPFLTNTVTNISVSGVFIRTANPLPEGAKINLEFTLPEGSVHIQALAEVRWIADTDGKRRRPEDSKPASGMGLEFVKIARKQQKAIETFVRGYLEKNPS